LSRKVTAKQAVTAAIVRESVKAGVPLSRDLLLTAHVEGYELSPTGDKSARQVASAYVTRNMRSPEFMAEVGLESKSTARRSSTSSLAGCSPVRLELSKDGQTAFVTNREENKLRVMDVAKILHGESDALVSEIHVGPAPIGVALVDDDRLALVTNSNRWGKEQKPQTVEVVDIAGHRRRKPIVLGKIPVGIFPRDLAVSRDGRTAIVSNFGSNSLTLLDVSKLRALMSRAKSN